MKELRHWPTLGENTWPSIARKMTAPKQRVISAAPFRDRVVVSVLKYSPLSTAVPTAIGLLGQRKPRATFTKPPFGG